MATLPTTGCYSANAFLARAQGVDSVFTYEEEFNLTTLLSAVIANGDVINLIQLPAYHTIIAASLHIVTAGTKDASTFTLQLRHSSSALSAALDATTDEGYASGGNAIYSLPLAATSAAYINLVAVVSGGNAVSTLNPKVKVKLVCVDMS